MYKYRSLSFTDWGQEDLGLTGGPETFWLMFQS